jgi:hypothetical protein
VKNATARRHFAGLPVYQALGLLCCSPVRESYETVLFATLAMCMIPGSSHAQDVTMMGARSDFPDAVMAKQDASTDSGAKEEIYIIRSVRMSRVPATEYCGQSRTGFADVSFEDQYIFHAVTTRVGDGAVIDPLGNKTASLHACFGKTADASIRNFYAEGEIAGIVFRGIGKCTTLRTDFPERGVSSTTCFLNLGAMKEPYVGGLLTTNSLLARNATGEQSDPPGYVQPSIATVRLWKRR